jgi:hypothetical protein
MMSKTGDPPVILLLHVMLREINPPVWQRILIRDDSSIADLHYTIQIAFNWSDFHLSFSRPALIGEKSIVD